MARDQVCPDAEHIVRQRHLLGAMLDPFSILTFQSPQSKALRAWLASGSSTVCSGFGVRKNQTHASPPVGCTVALVGFQ